MPPQITPNKNLAGLANTLQIGGNGQLQAKYGTSGGAPLPTTPNGVKTKAPGAQNQGIVNSIKPSYVAPQSQQTTTSNQGTMPSNNKDSSSSIPVSSNSSTGFYSAPNQSTGNMFQQSTQTQPQYPSFGGIVGSLVGASGANKAAQNYTQQTADYGAGNIPIAQQAQNIANQYGQQIADVGRQGAQFAAGQLTTGTSPVAEGNAAVTNQSTSQQQQALATGEQAALQGIGYQLTGQQQAANAANAAAGQAYTGQGQQITGLSAAAGHAAPQLGSPYQIAFSPVDQSQGAPLGSTGPGGLNGLAQQYGTFQGIQQGASALAAAPGTGQAQGIQAESAAPGTTAAGIYSQQQQQQAAYQSAHQQGMALQNQLTDLITQMGLNPSDLNAANRTIQAIAANTSDPRYKILQNYVNDVANTYSQILTPPGGSATDTTRGIAASMLDATAKGQSLITVMQSLDAAAQAKISNVPTSQGSLGGNGGGSSAPSGPITWDSL